MILKISLRSIICFILSVVIMLIGQYEWIRFIGLVLWIIGWVGAIIESAEKDIEDICKKKTANDDQRTI